MTKKSQIKEGRQTVSFQEIRQAKSMEEVKAIFKDIPVIKLPDYPIEWNGVFGCDDSFIK